MPFVTLDASFGSVHILFLCKSVLFTIVLYILEQITSKNKSTFFSSNNHRYMCNNHDFTLHFYPKELRQQGWWDCPGTS